jgi:hypothetical protein
MRVCKLLRPDGVDIHCVFVGQSKDLPCLNRWIALSC